MSLVTMSRLIWIKIFDSNVESFGCNERPLTTYKQFSVKRLICYKGTQWRYSDASWKTSQVDLFGVISLGLPKLHTHRLARTKNLASQLKRTTKHENN